MKAYNIWANQYDTNKNKTRDLEALALKEMLASISFESCLEVGCGTGKNTQWLIQKARHITAIDLSEEMLSRAKEKVIGYDVKFIHADINLPWNFGSKLYELVSFSLVLEHIRNLDHIFLETSKYLKSGVYVYIGELHPFKQYAGTKARFDTEEGRHIVECYTHNVSDFVNAATKQDLQLITLNEYFDEEDRSTVPRILGLLFKKRERWIIN